MEAPLYLIGLGLLVLPPLLRMLFPPRPVQLGFPQMRLLNQVLAKQKFRKQKNPWWLNLIRMLLIALLTLGLIGLRWRGSQIAPDASLAIVFDDSLYGHQINENGHQQWEMEKAQILDLLSSIPSAHRVAMVGRSGGLLEWTSAREASAWTEKKTPGYLSENWSTVLRNLTRLHRQREDVGFQVLFTGCNSSQDSSGYANLLENLPAGIYTNQEFFHFEPQPNRSLDLRALASESLINFQGKVSGEPKGSIRLSGPDGELTSLNHEGRFRTSVPNQKWVKVQLSGKDGFPLDDVVYVSNDQARPRRLFLLLRPEASQRLLDSGYYLKQGFETICENLGLDLTRLGPREWQNLMGRQGDVIILLHPPKLRKEEWNAIGESLTKGAHLLLLPGPTTPEDLLDDVKLSPARLKAGAGGERRVLWTKEWKTLAPKVTGLKVKGGWDFYHLNPKADILHRYESGGAYHLRLNLPSGGSFQLMSSPMAVHWSTSVLQPDFPAFLEHLLDTSLPPATFPKNLQPGIPWPQNILSIQPLHGETHEKDLLGPGVYRVESGTGEQTTLTRRFSADDYLARQLLMTEKEDGSSSVHSTTTSTGPRLDPILALGVLLFLGMEALLLRKQLPHLLSLKH